MIIDDGAIVATGLAIAAAGGVWGYALRRERRERARGGYVAMFENRGALARHHLARLLAAALTVVGGTLAGAFLWLRQDVYVDGQWLALRIGLAAAPIALFALWRLTRRKRRVRPA